MNQIFAVAFFGILFSIVLALPLDRSDDNQIEDGLFQDICTGKQERQSVFIFIFFIK